MFTLLQTCQNWKKKSKWKPVDRAEDSQVITVSLTMTNNGQTSWDIPQKQPEQTEECPMFGMLDFTTKSHLQLQTNVFNKQTSGNF